MRTRISSPCWILFSLVCTGFYFNAPCAAQTNQPLPQHTTESTRRVLQFYGIGNVDSLRQIPSHPVSQPMMSRGQRSAYKPFENESNRSTLSPYLNLTRAGESDAAPNYYTFVRPQQIQEAEQEAQNVQMQRMNRQFRTNQRQLPTMQHGGIENPRIPHFGNVGNYYNRRY